MSLKNGRAMGPDGVATELLKYAVTEVNEAMADAFRSGNLGILDYQKIKNIEADTRMRSGIAAGEEAHLESEEDRKKMPGQE